MAQRALGVVVGRRQGRIGDEGDDGVPIVEDFAGEFADLLLVLVAVALAVPLYARHQPLDGGRLRVLAFVDPLDQAAQVAHQVAAEAGVRAIIARGERQGFADQMRQAALAARMVAIGDVTVGDQPAQERLADQLGQFLLAAAADTENGGERRRRHPHPAQFALLIPGGLVDVNNLGRANLLDELLDDGLAGQTEFMDAALDRRGSEFQAQPVEQEFLNLAPREAETHRQRRDESGEHRADQTALAQLQIPSAALDLRARPDAGAGDGFMAARAAHGEIDVLGRRDLERHHAALEFEAHVGLDATAREVGTEGGCAGRTNLGRVRDFRARHDRLGAPEPFRSGRLAGGPGGLLLVRLAGFPRRGGGRLPAIAAVAPIGIVARRRARTRSRIRAQTVGQLSRQLVLPPSPSLELLARHRGEVGSLHILQVEVESAGHANRRIPFEPPRKSPSRTSRQARLQPYATDKNRGM